MQATIVPRPVQLVNHCFMTCTDCTSRTSCVKPFTGRICSTVLDKDGRWGDREYGNSRGDRSCAAERYAQARLPWSHGGDGQSETPADVLYTTIWTATTESTPANWQVFQLGDRLTVQ